MRDDLTIIYYTSNAEEPEFERRIQRTLMEQSMGLPIVSVSQRPTDFGSINICIGDIGLSPRNMLKQIRTGAKAASTRFVAMAESDVLYHSSYFDFVPPRDDTFYYTDNVYLLFFNRSRFYRKGQRSETSGIVNRDHLIQLIDKLLRGAYRGRLNVAVGRISLQAAFHRDVPTITIKTGNGMRFRHHDIVPESRRLVSPHWGTAASVLHTYFGNGVNP